MHLLADSEQYREAGTSPHPCSFPTVMPAGHAANPWGASAAKGAEDVGRSSDLSTQAFWSHSCGTGHLLFTEAALLCKQKLLCHHQGTECAVKSSARTHCCINWARATTQHHFF